MIIDTTNDELLINGQRWQRGGYLQATAYATDQINITARDGRVIGKALQWDAIYDQDKNLFGLNRDGVVTALTTVFNSRVKSPYNLEALRDVQDGTASYGDILIWSAPGEWQYDALTQYHHAYNSEAATLRAGATATTELYYTAQADGDGLSESAQSNTPAEGYQIVRKLYYAEAAQADPDTGTWVQFAALDPNTTYASAKATLLAYLKERTGGTVPISLKMTWEEVEEFDSLLDTYGGAAAAYSVRRLSSSYTGSLIQVERASDNTTQDIGYDSNGDLDTAAIATFCSGTTCGVRVWYDQSGNGNDATQTTFANQPEIYTGGAVNLENTKPALLVNNLNWFNLGTSIATTRQDFFVLLSNYNNVYVQNTASGINYAFAQVGANRWLFRYAGGAFDSRAVTFDTGQVLHSVVSGDGIYENAIQYSAFPSSLSITFDQILNGSSFEVQELIIYGSDQSTNRSGIETNVNDYFGIYTPFTTGLLDDYGGAAAAYSLRRLSSTYTGDAIRVRRASDNAEQDIGFDIEGNLNTAALASFCSGTNGFVKTWYCQSGNSNDATQTTTANQPKIYDSATGVITENGKPAIQTDGSDDTMSLTSTINFTDLTWFTVTKKTDTASNGSVIFFGGGSNAYGGDDVDNQGNPRLQAPSAAIIRNTLGNTSASGGEINQHLSYYNRNGTNASGGLNGEVNTEATVATTTFGLTELFQYGSNYNYEGLVQELVLYDSNKKSDRSGIESNINTFYSIY
jgi:hypothetical protein